MTATNVPWWKKFRPSEMFKRKPNRFIELLIDQARLTVEGMDALVAYFDKPTKRRAEVVSQANRLQMKSVAF